MMKNKEFARELERRTLKFAVRIIQLSSHLSNTIEGKVVRNQMTKSGTSVGANYREANRARSRADFHNKISTCEKEAVAGKLNNRTGVFGFRLFNFRHFSSLQTF
jgi:hypothetical protein